MMVKSRANQKLQSTQNNHEKYKNVIAFLESVAKELKIQLDETPNIWKEQIDAICTELDGPLSAEISSYVENLNIR